MEDWELDFAWLKVRHKVKDVLGQDQLPKLNAILIIIGIQELGKTKTTFTKEEKQDLMHIATCSLLAQEGYYAFEGLDEDGWPHYKSLKPFTTKGVQSQEVVLKKLIIQYFNKLEI